MTEQNNRVLARRNARGLTEDQMAEGGGVGTPVVFTFKPPMTIDQVGT